LTIPTPIYLAIIVEVERRRMQVGISMERMSELMGTAERSYAKMLYPDTPSGRCATWPTLQAAIDVLFCDGFDLRLSAGRSRAPRTTEGTKRLIRAEAAHWSAPAMRQRMADMGRKGGAARAASLSAQQRREMGLRGAAARWAKYGSPVRQLTA
jgi:hypothetical protein